MSTHNQTEVLVVRPAVSEAAAPRWELLGRPAFKQIVYLLADIAAVTFAYGLAMAAARALSIPEHNISPPGYALFFLPFFAAVLYFFGGYGNAELRRPERELELSCKAVSFAFVALLGAHFVFLKGENFSRYLIVFWYVLALLIVVSARFAIRGVYAHLAKSGYARQRTVLIGSLDKLLAYQRLLAVQRYQGYDILGVIADDDHAASLHSGAPVLSSLESWQESVFRHNVQLVVINLPASAAAQEQIAQVLDLCRQRHIEVELFTPLLSTNNLNYEVDHFTGCFRLWGKPAWSRQLQLFAKGLLDRGIGLFGSIITVLLLPFVALAVNLEDRGPIFYRSKYVGCDGRVHYYLKFRTMVKDADQILHSNAALKERFARNWKLQDDPRILRVGRWLRKYSIDEFPQFFSILIGKLTLVGPRTISPEETARYGDLLPKRLSMKPGLTGYWQVMGRQTTTYDEKILMDMFYLDHWSIWLDLVIIAKTFWKLIMPEGAY